MFHDGVSGEVFNLTGAAGSPFFHNEIEDLVRTFDKAHALTYSADLNEESLAPVGKHDNGLHALDCEDMAYLSLDRPFFMNEKLHNLLAGNALILSKRRNKENFKWELNELGIGCAFEVVGEAESKADWVRKHVSELVIAIGDSIEDLKIGTIKEVEVHMVGYGMGTKSEFEKTGIGHQFHERPVELYGRLKSRGLI